MEYKLELIDVCKSYGNKKVLNNLNLKVASGEFLVVLGPSGTGKSTLLRTIVGIEDIDSGRIIVNGEDVTKKPPNKRDISMVFQNYALYPNMNVFKNIAFPLKMAGVPRDKIKEKVENVARLLKIDSELNNSVTRLSGGQKQRVAIARALVRDPQLFLLDEPLSNIDARVRYTSRQELKRLQKELNYTFVYVTHDQAEASNIADRVAVLHNGIIEQIGTYEELYNRPVNTWVGDFIGNFPMNFIDGSELGYNEKIIGFRPTWVNEESNGIEVEVSLIDIEESNYFIHCTYKDKNIVFQSKNKYNVGDKIKIGLKKFNVYENGILKDVINEEAIS